MSTDEHFDRLQLLLTEVSLKQDYISLEINALLSIITNQNAALEQTRTSLCHSSLEASISQKEAFDLLAAVEAEIELIATENRDKAQFTILNYSSKP